MDIEKIACSSKKTNKQNKNKSKKENSILRYGHACLKAPTLTPLRVILQNAVCSPKKAIKPKNAP